jgi:signal transduction histidine kinase
MVFLATALFVSAGLALWLGARVARAPGPGTRPFVCLCAAVAVWCGAGGAHALADGLAAKLLLAKLQYLGIATVGPWWLLFTAEYAGAPRRRVSHRLQTPAHLLWVIPTATMLLVATNEWHHAIWTSVALTGRGRAIYEYGPWFWVAAAYNYALLALGSFIIIRRARRVPSKWRRQFVAVVAAAIVPWAANVVFLARWVPLDVTPLAFAVSSLLFAWALFRSALFDLVPVARDVVIDSLSDAMVVTDTTRRVLDMNAAATALARQQGTIGADGDAIARSLGVVFPMLRDVPLRTTALVTSHLPPEACEPLWFDVRVLPVGKSTDSPNAWVVLLRDVTDQRRAAAEHDALERRVQEQDRRESVSILAAGVAHEFNNLLTGIVGNADLLAMQVPASSTMETNVGEILVGAQRAAALVAKMLAYAGEGHAAIARVELHTLASDSVDLLRATAGGRCAIACSGTSASIDADPAQIRQVAANLIANAVEAIADGGQVTVATGTATLAAADLGRMRFGQDAPPGEYAFLDVRDDGVGMDEATMRRLFKPFFTTKPIGHGLGLAAVQGIVLGHRGALEVESRPGQGSRFRVWFPVARAADGSATAAIMRFDRTIRGDSGRVNSPRPPRTRLKESA